MDKSPDAFRTISEVADLLETPSHVLRFWETRFPQIRPVKRAGGRRYYRPSDIALLQGIKRLLHDEGMTIRGVQKMLREHGVRHVAAFGGGSAAVEEDSIEDQLAAALGSPTPTEPVQEPETAQIIALETVLAQKDMRPAAKAEDAPAGDLFDFAARNRMPPEPAAIEPDPAPVVEASSPAPAPVAQATDSEPDSTPTPGPQRLAARLRVVREQGAPLPISAAEPLRERLLGLRARLAEGTHRRPR